MSDAGRADPWQGILLLLHPPLSVLYLVALRAGWLEPSFGPPLLATAAPVAAAVLAALRLVRGADRSALALLAVATVEIVWAIAVLAVVGFAIAWRSG